MLKGVMADFLEEISAAVINRWKEHSPELE